jgi:hypothetical protein
MLACETVRRAEITMMTLGLGSVAHLTATAHVGQEAACTSKQQRTLQTRQESVTNDAGQGRKPDGVHARHVALWAERQRVAQRRYFLVPKELASPRALCSSARALCSPARALCSSPRALCSSAHQSRFSHGASSLAFTMCQCSRPRALILTQALARTRARQKVPPDHTPGEACALLSEQCLGGT